MMWREIKSTGEVYGRIPEIWAYEETLPRFFRASSKVWTPDEDGFRSFVDSCSAVWARDLDKGSFYVYVEDDGPGILIHLSVTLRPTCDEFISAMAELRDHFLSTGVKRIRGWMLKKNRPLAALTARLGFRETGLAADHGVSHGRLLRWGLIELVKA